LEDILYGLEDKMQMFPDKFIAELFSKAVKSFKLQRGLRKPRKIDVFIRKLYIYPDDFLVENFRRKPVAIFNPGAISRDNEILVFPRTVFDYYWYVSSISLFKISFRDVVEGSIEKPVKARLILAPKNMWELGKGLEDPRIDVDGDDIHILYTAVAPSLKGIAPLQAYALLSSSLEERRRGYIKILADEEYILYPWKDSALLEVVERKGYILTRPLIKYGDTSIEIGWKGFIDLNNLVIEYDTLEPILPFEEWELKVGWSTNAVKLYSNEYLVGWHAVLKSMVYVNGFAIVDKEGGLQAVTDYILVPETLPELYGDKPGVIFGCGLIKRNDLIYWIGGVSDFAIGIYEAELDKILENMREIKTLS